MKGVEKEGNVKSRYYFRFLFSLNILQVTFYFRYKDASKQLKKGEDLFNKVLSPLAQLQKGWRHVGLVCFPRIMSKDEIPKDKISVEDNQRIMKVKFKQCNLP